MKELKQRFSKWFNKERNRFGPRRKSGARRMRGLSALGDLATMRDLRVDVVG